MDSLPEAMSCQELGLTDVCNASYQSKLSRYAHQAMSKSILMYKTLHGMTPDYLRSRFVYRENVSAYRLRNSTENKLVLPQPQTDYLKRRFLTAELTCRTTYP